MAKDKIQAGEITWRESRLRIMRSNATETFEKSWREKTVKIQKAHLAIMDSCPLRLNISGVLYLVKAVSAILYH